MPGYSLPARTLTGKVGSLFGHGISGELFYNLRKRNVNVHTPDLYGQSEDVNNF
jgi:hypothetical protein